MSALGQKRTYAVQTGLSALPPKATSNATYGMSAKAKSGRPGTVTSVQSKPAARGKTTLISVNSNFLEIEKVAFADSLPQAEARDAAVVLRLHVIDLSL